MVFRRELHVIPICFPQNLIIPRRSRDAHTLKAEVDSLSETALAPTAFRLPAGYAKIFSALRYALLGYMFNQFVMYSEGLFHAEGFNCFP